MAEKITKVSVDTGRREKISVVVNPKGDIKVECTTTKKRSREV